MLCLKCNEEMVEKETDFKYMNHTMTDKILTCPVCGQVYIPEDYVRGKMRKVERTLEDK